MNFSTPIPVRQLAERIGATIIGDAEAVALGINEIHKVRTGDVTFSDVKKYFQKALDSAATIIILNEAADCPEGKTLLLCEQPFEAYDSLIRAERPFLAQNILVAPTAKIAASTIIEPNVVIGNYVTIGENCYIQSNVVIQEYTEIGDNVTILAGSIIGTDAFYYKKKSDGFHRWRSGGRVIIENNVDIGAGCTIAKGVSGDTIIGEGSKLDCQIHIGHGVVIGKNCLLAAQVGIGGKTIVGDGVVLYGQVGVAQNLHIGAGATVSAKSGVSKDLEAGKIYFGIPADDIRKKQRELATLRMLVRK